MIKSLNLRRVWANYRPAGRKSILQRVGSLGTLFIRSIFLSFIHPFVRPSTSIKLFTRPSIPSFIHPSVLLFIYPNHFRILYFSPNDNRSRAGNRPRRRVASSNDLNILVDQLYDCLRRSIFDYGTFDDLVDFGWRFVARFHGSSSSSPPPTPPLLRRKLQRQNLQLFFLFFSPRLIERESDK